MIENLEDGLNQLENKQAKSTNIRWELVGEKGSKTLFKVLERLHLQNQTISELYLDDDKTKYSSNLKNIFKSAKKVYEKLYTKETTSKVAINEFLSKIINRNY